MTRRPVIWNDLHALLFSWKESTSNIRHPVYMRNEEMQNRLKEEVAEQKPKISFALVFCLINSNFCNFVFHRNVAFYLR